jgi:lipopolysaccharide transport system permease protein
LPGAIWLRYKQTVIGAAWTIIRAFITMVVFTMIFGRIAQLPSDGTAPYFPRRIVSTAAVVVAFVEFLITFSILILLMV